MTALLLILFAAAPTVPPEGIIHVRHHLTRASACAVRADILLTAAHVTDDSGLALAWSDMAGNDGTAEWLWDDSARRDLSVMQITRGTPGKVWKLAQAAPHVGDRVRIVGYADDKPAVPRVVEARVLDVDAGHIDFSKSPGPGSSGYCVLNDADEVVAINHVYMPGSGGSVLWGTGVSVYGAWAPRLPKEGERGEH